MQYFTDLNQLNLSIENPSPLILLIYLEVFLNALIKALMLKLMMINKITLEELTIALLSMKMIKVL